MKKVTVSAPGKLMLLGEHAVVYGRPCIVTAVGQRMYVTVEQVNSSEFILNAPDVGIKNYKKPMHEIGSGDIPKGAKFVEMAIKSFTDDPVSRIKSRMTSVTGIKVTTKSEFSSLFGFGSSSASTVCVVKALAELTETKLNEKEIFDIAYKTVLDVQGKGSGFDVATATYGGTLYYVTGGKTIEAIRVKNIPLVVGYSGVKADTVALIDAVADKAKKDPESVEKIYTDIAELVEKARKSIEANKWKEVGEHMNANQRLLERLGVSILKLDTMIESAISAGAYGSKLSGAGGGDCMVAITSREKVQSVEDAIEYAGGQVIDVDTNVQGVRVEV